MCGFAGLWSPAGLDPDLTAVVGRMATALAHRGPDDAGTWCDAEAGLALGHRRLSIVDLSCEGHQPMASPSGRFMIAFNGEIYNFRALRVDLETQGVRFRGHSDTEVLLAGIERWGLEATVRRAAGMFAFALWDAAERVLYLVRDRIGEKPLYYGRMGDTFLFGSELKALRAHPAWQAEIDRDVLALFLRHNYVPAPHTIFAGVHKVMPGVIVSVRASRGGFETETTPYWSARAAAEAGLADPLRGDDEECVDALDAVLREVVGEQMVADVPLGAFLSGGVDSSTIVALMQALSPRPVRTFTIGFREDGFDEASHARAVAAHLGSEHTEWYVTPDDARQVVPRLPTIFDEPFADSSQIPTLLVAELTRRHVTVSLSGDGGDELFAGYGRYLDFERAWAKVNRVPRSARSFVGAGLHAPAQFLHRAVDMAGLSGRVPQLEDRMHRLSYLLGSATPEAAYRHFVSRWLEPERLIHGASEPETSLTAPGTLPLRASRVERAMLLDLGSYLPDDILVKVDRTTMAVSLESRAPFLDHRVVEFAWRLPLTQKLRDGRGKFVVRQLLDRYVPRELVERPKAGFAVPIGTWLRGPLRDWADDLLGAAALSSGGYFSADVIQRRWSEHRSGRQDWTWQLWPVLMFQAWLLASD